MSSDLFIVGSPIFAEIVPEKSRTSIYALDRSFESILASFAPPAVGYLSQHVYGFKPAAAAGGGGGVERDRENAASLAKALYAAIAIPMTACSAIYSFLYCTYPRDRDRARAMHRWPPPTPPPATRRRRRSCGTSSWRRARAAVAAATRGDSSSLDRRRRRRAVVREATATAMAAPASTAQARVKLMLIQ